MMRALALASALVVVSCAPAGDEPAPPEPSPAVGTPTPAASPAPYSGEYSDAAALVGEYRLAGVDGKDIDLPHGVSVVVREGRIDVTSGCVRFAWTYELAGGRIATATVPMISCQRGLFPAEQALEDAFDDARQVGRTPANGIELSGSGHSVLLFSQ